MKDKEKRGSFGFKFPSINLPTLKSPRKTKDEDESTEDKKEKSPRRSMETEETSEMEFTNDVDRITTTTKTTTTTPAVKIDKTETDIDKDSDTEVTSIEIEDESSPEGKTEEKRWSFGLKLPSLSTLKSPKKMKDNEDQPLDESDTTTTKSLIVTEEIVKEDQVKDQFSAPEFPEMVVGEYERPESLTDDEKKSNEDDELSEEKREDSNKKSKKPKSRFSFSLPSFKRRSSSQASDKIQTPTTSPDASPDVSVDEIVVYEGEDTNKDDNINVSTSTEEYPSEFTKKVVETSGGICYLSLFILLFFTSKYEP